MKEANFHVAQMGAINRVSLGVLLAIGMVACGDDGNPGGTQSVSTNNATMGDSNNAMTNTNNATTGTNNETLVCEPLDVCPSDVCGMVADGCEGFLDCGDCPCVAGVPAEATCGACGLGISVCGPSETGFGSCERPIPGIEELTCDDMLFVRNGALSGDGTKTGPVIDVNAALMAAKQNGQKLVVVGGSSTILSAGPVVLVEGIHLIGGFNEDFTPNPTVRPRIQNSDSTSPDVVAVSANSIDSATHIKSMIFSTADATSPGANTYGLMAVQSGGLVLTDVLLEPGRPGHGTPGVDGNSGFAGQDGFKGRTGNYRTNEGQAYPLQTNTLIGGLGCEGSARAGGNGGKGAGYSSSSNPSILLSATNGAFSGTLGTGGIAGLNYSGSSAGTSGHFGGNGLPGANVGVDGAGGSGLGMMALGQYFVRAANGMDGGLGEHGSGGTGGGGAGALNNNMGGPGGGSGGGGGCGGSGGTGGTQGGSSFGLVLQQSMGFAYTDLTTTPSAGGNGGDGGTAGAAGLGGVGGAGGDTLVSPNATKASGLAGGRGGNGGNGTRGGHGGGGAGGHSIAVWCDATYDIADMFRNPSSGGAGGASQGTSGDPGNSLADYDCGL